MRRSSDVQRSIARAERVLPGRDRRNRSASCPRWQALLAVASFIESDPLPVCDFALKWARRRGRDLQAAIYGCLTEHLLEHHFDLVLPRMRIAGQQHRRVAEHLFGLSTAPFKFGQHKKPANIRKLKRLEAELLPIYPTLR